MVKKGTPKKDGSGKGRRANRGRGGCITTKKKGKGRNRKRKTTKYGEPIRRFNKKNYRLQNKFAYEKDAKDYKKRVKKVGYLARITPHEGGFSLWVRNTPKSRKWEKEVMPKKRKANYEKHKATQARLQRRKTHQVQAQYYKQARKSGIWNMDVSGPFPHATKEKK